MLCSNCFKELEDNWSCCPFCRTEIDKAGGIDSISLNELMSARKNSLALLETIINELEAYGKLETASSLLSSGANIASGLLCMFVPGKPVTVFADVVSSGLSIANSGVSLLSKWAEHGLLQRADKVCKVDKMCLARLGPVVPILLEMIHKRGKCSQIVFLAKAKEFNTLYKSGKWQEYSYQATKTELKVSVLGNLAHFLTKSINLCNGNYSSVAEKLKAERTTLLKEFKNFSTVPVDVLDMKWK